MAVIPYSVKENKTLGTHSFYCQAQSFSTLSHADMADEVVEGLGISPDMVPTIIKRYMRVAIRNVQRGHRVKLADELVIYPQISCTVKDVLNDDGTVKTAATADMLNIQSAKSSIGATISQAVQAQFAKNVSWKRVGDPDDEQPSTNPDGSDSSDSSSSDSGTTSGPVLTITKTGAGSCSVTDQTGHQIDSGDEVTAGQNCTLTVTPAGSQAPTATLGTTALTLVEDEGTYTATFQMPSTSTTLTVNTAPGDNE